MKTNKEQKFTRGLAESYLVGDAVRLFSGEQYVGTFDSFLNREKNEANAQLAVSAFNSATRASDMGFDGQAAVELAPDALQALTRMLKLHDDTINGVSEGAEWQMETLRMTRDLLTKAKVQQ